MSFNLLRLTWMFVHVLYSFIHFLVFIWINVRKKCEELLSRDPTTDDLGFISLHIKLLVKVPSHLVVIIGSEHKHISFDDLTNISVWCIAAGISFVTFYDHSGILKKSQVDFVKALSKKSKDHINKIVWGKSLSNGFKKNGTNGINVSNGTNGYSSPRLTVNLFSLSDGKGSIVEMTKSLCEPVVSGNLALSNVTPEYIDEMLHRKLGIPEPELAFYCGNSCSTYGFLPWHIRVTEFLHLPSHRQINVTDFMALLKQYGDSKQRCGK